MSKKEKPTFEWGVFIEIHDSTGTQYEVMLPDAMSETLHAEIVGLLTNPKTSKSKLLYGGKDLAIKW
tara:strand:+ start:521 stop:721 length:201 start_codon:yes stop_codon:yes gene_type:complete